MASVIEGHDPSNEFLKDLSPIIEHIFLPAGLPSHANDTKIGDKILKEFFLCFQRFSQLVDQGDREACRAVIRALTAYQDCTASDGEVIEEELKLKLQLLLRNRKSHCVPPDIMIPNGR